MFALFDDKHAFEGSSPIYDLEVLYCYSLWRRKEDTRPGTRRSEPCLPEWEVLIAQHLLASSLKLQGTTAWVSVS